MIVTHALIELRDLLHFFICQLEVHDIKIVLDVIDVLATGDHDTTLTNVAAGKGICLPPGFLNDHSGQFAWIPFDCEEHFECVLCTHKNDSRETLSAFIAILKKLYRDAVAFPDRKSTRLNSSHPTTSRMPSSA